MLHIHKWTHILVKDCKKSTVKHLFCIPNNSFRLMILLTNHYFFLFFTHTRIPSPTLFMSFTANVIDISYLTIASFPAGITAEAMAHFTTNNVFICHLTIDFNLNSNQALNASNYLETF